GTSDPYALLTPYVGARRQVGDPEKDPYVVVDLKYTTKPLKRCQTTSVESPLSQPPDLSGSFLKTKREATFDRNGNPLLMSNRQQARGPIVERDYSFPTIVWTYNTASLIF